jgi:hypothetical protein
LEHPHGQTDPCEGLGGRVALEGDQGKRDIFDDLLKMPHWKLQGAQPNSQTLVGWDHKAALGLTEPESSCAQLVKYPYRPGVCLSTRQGTRSEKRHPLHRAWRTSGRVLLVIISEYHESEKPND